VKVLRNIDSDVVDLCLDLSIQLSKEFHMSSSEKMLAATNTPPGNTSKVSTVFACALLHNDTNASLELKNFLNATTSRHMTQSVFSSVAAPLGRLKAAAGGLLFDLCLSLPWKTTAQYSLEESWTALPRSDEGMYSSSFTNENMLPQLAITQVLLYTYMRTCTFVSLLIHCKESIESDRHDNHTIVCV
jgi:hypothetical protein